MKMTPVICTNCTAPLFLKEGSHIANCQYCGTSFFVEPDVHAAMSRNDHLIQNAGIAFNKLKDYEKAYQYYKDAVYEKADDFRGYAGMLYTKIALNEEMPAMSVFEDMKKIKNDALQFANEEQTKQISDYWKAYVARLEEQRMNKISANEAEIRRLQTANQGLEKNKKTLLNKYQSFGPKIIKLEAKIGTARQNRFSVGFMIPFVIIYILILQYIFMFEASLGSLEMGGYIIYFALPIALLFIIMLCGWLIKFIRYRSKEDKLNVIRNESQQYINAHYKADTEMRLNSKNILDLNNQMEQLKVPYLQ